VYSLAKRQRLKREIRKRPETLWLPDESYREHNMNTEVLDPGLALNEWHGLTTQRLCRETDGGRPHELPPPPRDVERSPDGASFASTKRRGNTGPNHQSVRL